MKTSTYQAKTLDQLLHSTLSHHLAIIMHSQLKYHYNALEENWMRDKNISERKGWGSRQQRNMVMCTKCGLSAHLFPVEWKRRIFQMEPLRGLGCFAIAHHKHCTGLWKSQERNKNMQDGGQKQRKLPRYRVHTTHPVYQELKYHYGVMDDSDDEEFEFDS